MLWEIVYCADLFLLFKPELDFARVDEWSDVFTPLYFRNGDFFWGPCDELGAR